MHLKASTAPLYLYRFAYRGQRSFTDMNPQLEGENFGVVHSDDLMYLFEMRGLFPGVLSNSDKAASDRYVQNIVEFVVNGRPTENVPCTEMKPMCNYVNFYKNEVTGDMETQVRNDFDIDMVRFWAQTGEIPL